MCWFNLGDRDLAIGLERQRALRAGRRLTEAQGDIATALGVEARVLPMSDHPVRTHVLAHERWWPFQEFMIRGQARGPVDDVDFRGARASRASPEALAAVAQARTIIIGPSNPVISIGPILAVDDLHRAIDEAAAPVVAVSPIVDGEVVKGPTAAFMQWAGHDLDGAGVAAMYAGLIDGLVADGAVQDVALLQTDTLMNTTRDRARVAEKTLNFALTLTQSG